MAFIISGLYRNMGNAASAAASAAKKAEENVMRRRQDPQGPGGTVMRQGQRPPPSSMTMRSGKKTAKSLISFKEMNSGLQSTINALIEKDGGTSKNFVLLEFRNRIQRNEALIDQLKLFNRLILDPDDTEVMAQKAKGRNFNNSRSVNRVGIWTGADNKQFPAVALQSVVGRYPGLFRYFFRENGRGPDSLLRVASASNEYNFWKYDGSRNIRMNDRGEFDTIVLLCVISPNNDTTYDLDRDTRNRNSLYEGLLYATDKTFLMLAYKAKSKDLPFIARREPVLSRGAPPARPPALQLTRLAFQEEEQRWGESPRPPAVEDEEDEEDVALERARPPSSIPPKAAGITAAVQSKPMTYIEAVDAGWGGVAALRDEVATSRSAAEAASGAAEMRVAIAKVKQKINKGEPWKFSDIPKEDPKTIEILREYNKHVKNVARSAAQAPSGSAAAAAEEAAKEVLKQVESANILNNLPDMQGQQGAAREAAVKAAAAYTRAKTALEAAKGGDENTAAAEEAVEKAEQAMKSIEKLLPRPKGGSRRTKKRKIERTRRRNKTYGR